MKDVLSTCEDHMKKSLAHLEHELSGLRTGRATPALLDSVKVEYYGTLTPLNQCATISVPEPRMLTVQPWDKSILGTVVKAIQAANLGLNPINDAHIIRVPIPPMTEERRQEITRVVSQITEDNRVAVRNVRRDSNDKIKTLEKNKEISEDDARNAVDRIQEMTNEYVEKMNDLQKVKEEEILND